MIGLKTSEYTRYSFDYPVMIFNSFKNIFSATNNMEITENFQRAVDYSYKIEKEQINKYFIIDVVSFEMLDSFLDKIEKSDIAIMINKALSDIKEERFNRNFSNSSPSNFFDAI